MHPQATYERRKQYEDLDQDLKKELLSLTDNEIKNDLPIHLNLAQVV